MKIIVENIKKLETYNKFNRLVFAYRLKNHHLVQFMEDDFWLFSDKYFFNNYVEPVIKDINMLIVGDEDNLISNFSVNNHEINPWLAFMFERFEDKKKYLSYFLLHHSRENDILGFTTDECQIKPKVSDDKYGLTYLSLPLNVKNRAIEYK